MQTLSGKVVFLLFSALYIRALYEMSISMPLFILICFIVIFGVFLAYALEVDDKHKGE